MAKIKYSAIGITNMSGKSGGSVFAFNRSGSYVRRWAKPTNPMTDIQTAVRQSFGALSRAYGTLTNAQREAWRVFGIDNPKVDRLGDSRPMQPMSAFMSANQNRNTLGLPSVTDPVENAYNLPGFVLGRINVDVTGSDIELDVDLTGMFVTPIPANSLYAVVALAVVGSASAKSYGSVVNSYKYATSYPISSGSTTIDFSQQVIDAGVVVGQNVFVKVELYNTAGQKTEGVTLSAVAV